MAKPRYGRSEVALPSLVMVTNIAAWCIELAFAGYFVQVNSSYPFDPDLHRPGSVAARGRCSWHGVDGTVETGCEGEAVVSFQDHRGHWQSGCQRALEDLVEREEIEPLGQGA